MKRLYITCAFSALTWIAIAQNEQAPVVPMSGELQVKTGLGNISPLDAKLQLSLKGSQFSLKPYVGLTTISKSGSGELEDSWLFYSGTSNAYSSVTETSKKGQTYVYGISGTYVFNPFASLSFGVDGSVSSLHGYGSRKEAMSDLLSSMAADKPFITDIDRPTLNTNSLKANVAYTQRLKDQVSSFSVRGNMARESSDTETYIHALSGVGLFAFKENYLHQNNATTSASLTGEYQRSIDKMQAFTLGLHYDYRNIESDNRQFIDQKKQLDEFFTHDMNVVGFYGAYRFMNKDFNVNARLEYTYTDMNGKSLHDVTPSVNAIWHMMPGQDLQFVYGMRVVRPDVSYLNPAKIYGAYTIDYGTPDLEGIHINNFSLSHILKNKAVRFCTTVSHVRAKDGFNAIWMVKDGMRVSFWGNEGIRRAWSVTPDLTWTISPFTTLDAKIIVMWDKRIAEAIHMAKEHWGITSHLGLKQQLPYGMKLNLHGDYSEGNTIDLYSHSGKMVAYGGELQRAFLPKKNLMLTLAYSNTDYAKTILTQGAYTGEIFVRPEHHYILSLSADWMF